MPPLLESNSLETRKRPRSPSWKASLVPLGPLRHKRQRLVPYVLVPPLKYKLRRSHDKLKSAGIPQTVPRENLAVNDGVGMGLLDPPVFCGSLPFNEYSLTMILQLHSTG